MSPRLALPLLLLLAVVAPSHAGQVNLRWDSCWGDGGVVNRAFACDTNAGSDQVVGSFIPSFEISDVAYIRFQVLVATAGTTIQPWWQIVNAGSCRQFAIELEGDPPEDAVACADWDQASAVASPLTYQLVQPMHPQNRVLLGRFDMPTGQAATLSAGQEYHLFTLRISREKTVGGGACSGCELPACLWFIIMLVDTKPETTTYFLSSPEAQGPGRLDATATWQGGGGNACQFPVNAQRSTWGAVKSLYR